MISTKERFILNQGYKALESIVDKCNDEEAITIKDYDTLNMILQSFELALENISQLEEEVQEAKDEAESYYDSFLDGKFGGMKLW